MTVTHSRAQAEESAAYEAATLCEAFQSTVAAHADAAALRIVGDTRALTWGEYGSGWRGSRVAWPASGSAAATPSR